MSEQEPKPSPAAMNILRVAVNHAKQTSPTLDPLFGHNSFSPHFDHLAGPRLVCEECGAELPLDAGRILDPPGC